MKIQLFHFKKLRRSKALTRNSEMSFGGNCSKMTFQYLQASASKGFLTLLNFNQVAKKSLRVFAENSTEKNVGIERRY